MYISSGLFFTVLLITVSAEKEKNEKKVKSDDKPKRHLLGTSSYNNYDFSDNGYTYGLNLGSRYGVPYSGYGSTGYSSSLSSFPSQSSYSLGTAYSGDLSQYSIGSNNYNGLSGYSTYPSGLRYAGNSGTASTYPSGLRYAGNSGIASTYSTGVRFGSGYKNLENIGATVSNVRSHEIHTVTKHVPVAVPQPYPVQVTKTVNVPQPYPVEKPVPYPVRVNVPVEVPKPYPVKVSQPVPYPVEVPKPYAVKVSQPYPVPVEVKVPVEVHKPYPVHITKTVKVPVEKPVYVKVPHPVPVTVKEPYPVPVGVSHIDTGFQHGEGHIISDGFGSGFNDAGVSSGYEFGSSSGVVTGSGLESRYGIGSSSLGYGIGSSSSGYGIGSSSSGFGTGLQLVSGIEKNSGSELVSGFGSAINSGSDIISGISTGGTSTKTVTGSSHGLINSYVPSIHGGISGYNSHNTQWKHL